MLLIPIETPNHAHDAVIVVLNAGNLTRMAEADPVEIELRKCGRNLVNPTIVICHEEESRTLTRLIQGHDVDKIIAHLQRGWKFRPDRGDHDRGPESIRDGN